MASRLHVPFSPQVPAPQVEARLVDRKPGQVLDYGRVQSEWGAGDIILTSLGVVLVDEESGEAIGIRWCFVGGAPVDALDPERLVVVPVSMPGQEPIQFSMSGRLVGNMGALAGQLGSGTIPTEEVLILDFDHECADLDVIDLRGQNTPDTQNTPDIQGSKHPIAPDLDVGQGVPGETSLENSERKDLLVAETVIAASKESDVRTEESKLGLGSAGTEVDLSSGSAKTEADERRALWGDDAPQVGLHQRRPSGSLRGAADGDTVPGSTDTASTDTASTDTASTDTASTETDSAVIENTDTEAGNMAAAQGVANGGGSRAKGFYKDPNFWVGLGAAGARSAARKFRS